LILVNLRSSGCRRVRFAYSHPDCGSRVDSRRVRVRAATVAYRSRSVTTPSDADVTVAAYLVSTPWV